jgi:hypothetical protein
MNKIVTFISISGKSEKYVKDLRIENFIAINEDPLGAEISRLIIWFTYLNLTSEQGSASSKLLTDSYSKIQVIEDNPLQANWKVASKQKLPEFIFGVPTFKGWHKMTDHEKNLFNQVAKSFNPSNLDYSSAWLVKAAGLIGNSETKACFGLTNSLV